MECSIEGVVLLSGLIAGFIDSIVGGGGLITLPTLLWVLKSGPEAIGTNKIVGASAALAALIVYARAGHFDWRRSLKISIAVGIGSVVGSLATPFLPEFLFRWFILFISPLILWLIWKKEMRAEHRPAGRPHSEIEVLAWAFLSGVYDGMWGPGGGTFMFLVLFLGARLPLMEAIASSKLANTISASFALGSFAVRGYVHWGLGAAMAGAIVIGALIGARYNTKSAAKLVRPVLIVVTVLLVVRVIAS